MTHTRLPLLVLLMSARPPPGGVDAAWVSLARDADALAGALEPYELCAVRHNSTPLVEARATEAAHEAAHARSDPPPPRARCGDHYMARDRTACHLNAFNDNTACLLAAPGSFDRRWRDDGSGGGGGSDDDPAFDRWGRAPAELVAALLDARYRTLVFWGDSTMWHDAFALQVEFLTKSI